MKAVRGFIVTGVLGMNLALFWVSAYATPDVEPDLTVPLVVVLLIVGQTNLSPACDVALYPYVDIGKLQRYLRPGCVLRLGSNPQTVVVSESVNLNDYQWLPPVKDVHAVLHLIPKPVDPEIAIVLPDQDKLLKVMTDLREFPPEYIQPVQLQPYGVGERGAVNVIGVRQPETANGGGDKDDDPNWIWRLLSWIKSNLLCGGKAEREIIFPEEPLNPDNDLVDPKRAVSPTASEKTVYWTLQWEGGPPSRPINPSSSRRRANLPAFRPVSPVFSIISEHTGCFCWRRRTNHIVLLNDPILPDFQPVGPLSPTALTVSIETQLNALVLDDPVDSAGIDSGISDQSSISISELPCSEDEDLTCPGLIDSGSESTEESSVTEEVIHPANSQGYIHLDALSAVIPFFEKPEEISLNDVLWEEN